MATVLFVEVAVNGFSLRLPPSTFGVVFAQTVFLGVPAALIVWRGRRFTALTALILGFVVGALPLFLIQTYVLILSALGSAGKFDPPGFMDLVYAVVNLAIPGLYGAAGGIGAWGAWTVSARRPIIMALIVIAALSLILGRPTVTEDRSCHNPFRDGRTSISSQVNARLILPETEWSVLMQLFRAFAEANDWSLRDDADQPPGLRNLSVCNVDGTQIAVFGLARREDETIAANISVYQPQGGDSWKAPARLLLKDIDARWPGRFHFTGPDGSPIDPPPFYRDE